jgi:hypothetical protein
MARQFTEEMILSVRQKIDDDTNHVIIHEILRSLAGLFRAFAGTDVRPRAAARGVVGEWPLTFYRGSRLK